ncbi:MAG: LysM domain-containing protein [Deltaproteobacteria bacterium]|nr:LysM domain-containing protein [Deltaproteobacteria bacterium]
MEEAAKANLFPPTSRYHGIGTAVLTIPEGRPVVYLRRRFIPPPENFALLQEHTVSQGERVDNLAARYLGDPELYWRLCDANAVLHPEDLTAEPGSRIRITLPAGIPGIANA